MMGPAFSDFVKNNIYDIGSLAQSESDKKSDLSWLESIITIVENNGTIGLTPDENRIVQQLKNILDKRFDREIEEYKQQRHRLGGKKKQKSKRNKRHTKRQRRSRKYKRLTKYK
jgi:hypothetical protein